MKIGIMQPYIFPYIGYFQLVNSVDRFVVYDDVNFIKQGWINRNKILLNGNDFIFTVPLKNASSYTTIANTEINDQLYTKWRDKFLKTLTQAYSKAPHYKTIFDLVTSVFIDKNITISELASKSILETCRYIGINTEFILTATAYGNNELKAQDRVIDICSREKAIIYINPIGGQELYANADFAKAGLQLQFIKPGNIVYPQFNGHFVPALSIIDVMMFNALDEIQGLLKEYRLI